MGNGNNKTKQPLDIWLGPMSPSHFLPDALVSNKHPNDFMRLPDYQKLQHIGYPLGISEDGTTVVVNGHNDIQHWPDLYKVWDPPPSRDYDELQPVLQRLGSGYGVLKRFARDMTQPNLQGFQRNRRKRSLKSRRKRRSRRSKFPKR
tara:strand:- start:1200 stop:1640 length:441 start_codon:yes stop_codon:yes gene_type:complete